MHRWNFMFTNKKHSVRGMISSVLGVIALVGMILAIMLSYKERGAANPRYGLALLWSFVFAIGGMVQGVRSKLERDVFLFFPILGIATNTIVILSTFFILYAGVYGL